MSLFRGHPTKSKHWSILCRINYIYYFSVLLLSLYLAPKADAINPQSGVESLCERLNYRIQQAFDTVDILVEGTQIYTQDRTFPDYIKLFHSNKNSSFIDQFKNLDGAWMDFGCGDCLALYGIGEVIKERPLPHRIGIAVAKSPIFRKLDGIEFIKGYVEEIDLPDGIMGIGTDVMGASNYTKRIGKLHNLYKRWAKPSAPIYIYMFNTVFVTVGGVTIPYYQWLDSLPGPKVEEVAFHKVVGTSEEAVSFKLTFTANSEEIPNLKPDDAKTVGGGALFYRWYSIAK